MRAGSTSRRIAGLTRSSRPGAGSRPASRYAGRHGRELGPLAVRRRCRHRRRRCARGGRPPAAPGGRRQRPERPAEAAWISEDHRAPRRHRPAPRSSRRSWTCTRPTCAIHAWHVRRSPYPERPRRGDAGPALVQVPGYPPGQLSDYPPGQVPGYPPAQVPGYARVARARPGAGQRSVRTRRQPGQRHPSQRHPSRAGARPSGPVTRRADGPPGR